ncbi:unnamed protein product [Caenorhabditis bovis]|uniref:CYtochrome P450 family n=1 Tax=Caenorhabditis bovis TaxID=2654633 RepID=A0A8S1EX47_9PELO|nr:unnamed protein product [Caenorhabditis bovis]
MAVEIYVILVFLIYIIFNASAIYNFVKERRRVISLLKKVPGPLALPIIGTTFQFKLNPKAFAQQMRDWAGYYNKVGTDLAIFWIGPHPMVIALNPVTIKAILESNVVINKSREYEIFLPWLGTGLLLAGGSKWRQRRKMLTPSFHFQVLNDFQAIFDYQSKILVDQLNKKVKETSTFDIFPFIKRCALDIICETAMGSTVNAQTYHSHPYVKAVSNMNILSYKYQRMPWLWIKPIKYLSGFAKQYEKNLATVTNFTKEVIESKTKEFEEAGNSWGNKDKKAFLDMLIELKEEGGLTYEDIREEVDTFMFEGHDTTSAGIGWTLWCLANNPENQKKAQQELDEIFGDSNRECTIDDLKQMKYVEKCVKEALRLRPSVPHFARIIEEDIDINGVTVPRGTSILISPAFIQNSDKFFDNPEIYDPERFSEENITKRPAYTYIPFSAGPRNCIGQKFALQEEKTVISWVLRKFEVFTDIGLGENMPLPETILRPELGFPITLTPRV